MLQKSASLISPGEVHVKIVFAAPHPPPKKKKTMTGSAKLLSSEELFPSYHKT
jgi:hypothetical protein